MDIANQSGEADPNPIALEQPPYRIGSEILGFCGLATTGIVAILHAPALVGFTYYLVLWLAFAFVFDRRQLFSFFQTYLVNSFYIAVFVAIQIYNYPDSYGTTSPFGSQTDDSYFFSLLADEIPSGLETRQAYYAYEHTFSDLIRYLTPFRIEHPLDVLFFMSGVAAVVSVYSGRFAYYVTQDARVEKTTYLLCLVCPLLMMGGGVVLVRDSLIAGLIMLSLWSVVSGRYITFAFCLVLHFLLRSGTALLVLPLYWVVFSGDIFRVLKAKDSRKRMVFLSGMAVFAALALFTLSDRVQALLEEKTVYVSDLSRAGMIDDYLAVGGQGSFVWIQLQPMQIKVFLATFYMLLNPFFSLKGVVTPQGFDFRTLLLCVLYPLFMFFIHPLAFASVFTNHKFRQRATWILIAFLLECLFIGVYSLQSRHKTIIQPLYYVLAGIGLYYAKPSVKFMGFMVSTCWLIAQLVIYFRS